jgi:PEGA domain
MRAALVAALLFVILPAAVRADEVDVVWIGGHGSAEVQGRGRRWQARLARALEARGASIDTSDAWARVHHQPNLGRVARLAALEDELARAAEVRTGEAPEQALTMLVSTERRALELLDIPSSSEWLVEVRLALAATAYELGYEGLARAALERALSIEPSRVFQAADAPPERVAESRATARRLASAPRGRFEVRCDAPDARVYVDDTEVGVAPARIDVSAGEHVLRVQAPGYEIWARAIDVLAGQRAPVAITLAEDTKLVTANELADAIRALDFTRVQEALDQATGLRALWVVVPSEGALDRALLIECRASGCADPLRLDVSRIESRLPEPDAPFDAARSPAFTDALAWLEEPLEPIADAPQQPGWWEQPWVWTIVGVAVTAALGATIAGTAQTRQATRVLVEFP